MFIFQQSIFRGITVCYPAGFMVNLDQDAGWRKIARPPGTPIAYQKKQKGPQGAIFLENWWNWCCDMLSNFKSAVTTVEMSCFGEATEMVSLLNFGCVLFLYCQSCFGVACVGVCQSWCLIHQMQLLTNPTYTTWSFKYPRNSTTIEIILVCRVLFHNTGAPISSTSHAQRNNDNKRAHKPILIGWCSWWYPGFQLHLVLQPMFPTVDGRNSALNIPLFTGFCTSQVV